MKPIRNVLLCWIKKIFSDSHNVIVAAILSPLLAGGSMYLFAKNLWIQLIIAMQLPVPLWATIALVFLAGVYVQTKTSQYYSSKSSRKPFLFEDNGVKWMASYFGKYAIKVNDTPYCAVHNSKYYKTPAGQYMCRETLQGNCKSPILNQTEINQFHSLAEIKAQNIANNFKTKC